MAQSQEHPQSKSQDTAMQQDNKSRAPIQPEGSPFGSEKTDSECPETVITELPATDMPADKGGGDSPVLQPFFDESSSPEKRKRPAEDLRDHSQSPSKRLKTLDAQLSSAQHPPSKVTLKDQKMSLVADVSIRDIANDDASGTLSPVPDDLDVNSATYQETFGTEIRRRWSDRKPKQVEPFDGLVPTDMIDENLEPTIRENIPNQGKSKVPKAKSNSKIRGQSSSEPKASQPHSSKEISSVVKDAKRKPKVTSTEINKGRASKSTSNKASRSSDDETLSKVTTLVRGPLKTDGSPKTKPRKELKGKTHRKKAQKCRSLTVKLPLLQPDLEKLELPDPKRLLLSRRLAERQPLYLKAEPLGVPEVWAESRQALCETLPYFKSPQSGCYMNDGHVYGFLFDSIGHCREYMDEDVIICRAGGSMEPDGSGGMIRRKDHSLKEAQVKAVLNDIAHQNPIVVICGSRNVSAPCKMPHQYCVLGWYKPTFVWSEKTAGKGEKVWTTIKFRLERLNSHLAAWHARKDPFLAESDREIAGDLYQGTCDRCGETSPQVYLRWWVCLNASCAVFWETNGLQAPHETKGLEYNPAFILHRSEPWGEPKPEPAPLRPPLPDIGNLIGDNLTYVNTRGICCPKCGRCNSRRFFRGWVCENPACDFELVAAHRPLAPAMLHTPWDVAPTLVRNKKDPSVQLTVENRYGYKISTYSFGEKIKGRFIHAAATNKVLKEEEGPNDMFTALQTEDLGLERRTFAVKRSSASSEKSISGATTEQHFKRLLERENGAEGDLMGQSQELISGTQELGSQTQGLPARKAEFAEGDLMTAFSMNYGMPYKFVARGSSKAFEEGPWPVTEARRRLNWAVREFLGQTENDMDLNEELIFAYLEGQKIEYHDDGEKGLGPRIATLSLGGRAKMHLRMKAKHFVGCSKLGVLTEDEPVPGSLEFEKRHEHWKELRNLKEEEPSRYNARRREIPKELGIYEKRSKKADDLVTITLSHGDIVIMDGYDIQKYLEHKVVPEGYLRFALTCRTVLEDHLSPDEYPDYEVKVDQQKYKGPNI